MGKKCHCDACKLYESFNEHVRCAEDVARSFHEKRKEWKDREDVCKRWKKNAACADDVKMENQFCAAEKDHKNSGVRSNRACHDKAHDQACFDERCRHDHNMQKAKKDAAAKNKKLVAQNAANENKRKKFRVKKLYEKEWEECLDKDCAQRKAVCDQAECLRKEAKAECSDDDQKVHKAKEHDKKAASEACLAKACYADHQYRKAHQDEKKKHHDSQLCGAEDKAAHCRAEADDKHKSCCDNKHHSQCNDRNCRECKDRLSKGDAVSSEFGGCCPRRGGCF